jgi:hypothetical protein
MLGIQRHHDITPAEPQDASHAEHPSESDAHRKFTTDTHQTGRSSRDRSDRGELEQDCQTGLASVRVAATSGDGDAEQDLIPSAIRSRAYATGAPA